LSCLEHVLEGALQNVRRWPRGVKNKGSEDIYFSIVRTQARTKRLDSSTIGQENTVRYSKNPAFLFALSRTLEKIYPKILYFPPCMATALRFTIPPQKTCPRHDKQEQPPARLPCHPVVLRLLPFLYERTRISK